ncbi:unnamed protein product [Leptosia nina]|uniref:Uncharacterized protein n=1 Tax=Leptosia nina TaxID=320188 RepID=A0AAV1JJ69_9NEOP
MCLYDTRVLLLLLLNVALIQNKETIIIRTSEEVKENAFVDVLKNITSANQILQDLIKNYEQLQNIYKSDEEKSNSDASDSEKNNQFKALSSSEYTTITSKNKVYGVTQIIYTGETEESIEEQSIEDQKNNSKIIVVESSEFKEIDPTVSGNRTEHFSDNYEEIVTQQSNEKHDTKKNVKTRFSIQKETAKRNFNKVRPSLRQAKDKVIKRVVYAEVFSPDKIWHEVIHKPIKLKLHDDRPTFRIPNRKPSSNVNDENLSVLADSGPDDEVIEKEKYKSLILRNAYGDACLQVAVRKCFKALKAVIKAVCRLRYKCKSALKGSFIENAKKGCIREFVNGKDSKKDKKAEEIIFERTIGTEVSKYIDLCLPHLRSDEEIKKGLQNKTKKLNTLNILRDRFEKACKKLSAQKCRKACKFATDNACATHTCQNSKKRAFKKSCKSECRVAYNLYKATSDSDEDDDEESESGSDQ